MELDFDKEIDALLRKKVGGAAAGRLTSAHLGADEIAAFAENALPAGARSFYTTHLADCDQCRSILARTVSLYSEAEEQPAFSSAAPAVLSQVRVPWYRKLFAMPNLAATMGGLALIFAGLLGYLVYQGTLVSRNAEVSKLSKADQAGNTAETYSSSAPSAANASSNTAAAANYSQPEVTSGGSPMTKTVGVEATPETAADADKPAAIEEDERRDLSKQPAPLPAGEPMTPMREEPAKGGSLDDKTRAAKELKKADTKTEVTVDGADSLRNKDAQIQNQTQNNVSGPAPKMKSGPYVNQQRSVGGAADSSINEKLPVNGRRVAGKTFEKKEGVWYDQAYRGQSTKNVSRGSSGYRSLDGGLKSIAEGLDGTVVVVWREKAYRIQEK